MECVGSHWRQGWPGQFDQVGSASPRIHRTFRTSQTVPKCILILLWLKCFISQLKCTFLLSPAPQWLLLPRVLGFIPTFHFRSRCPVTDCFHWVQRSESPLQNQQQHLQCYCAPYCLHWAFHAQSNLAWYQLYVGINKMIVILTNAANFLLILIIFSSFCISSGRFHFRCPFILDWVQTPDRRLIWCKTVRNLLQKGFSLIFLWFISHDKQSVVRTVPCSGSYFCTLRYHLGKRDHNLLVWRLTVSMVDI